MSRPNAERSRYAPKFPSKQRTRLLLEARRKARKHKVWEDEDQRTPEVVK